MKLLEAIEFVKEVYYHAFDVKTLTESERIAILENARAIAISEDIKIQKQNYYSKRKEIPTVIIDPEDTGEPATEKQIKCLDKLGIPRLNDLPLTKKRASRLISEKVGKK